MPRTGAQAAEVVDIIARAGGVASMAHPGVTKRDELIPRLVSRGLTAIEVWHSDHDDETTMRYLAQAEALGLHMTGGSDYHGDLPDRNARLGAIGIPQAAFDGSSASCAMRARASSRAAPPRRRDGARHVERRIERGLGRSSSFAAS